MKITPVGNGGDALVEPPLSIAKSPAERIVGHDAQAHLVGDDEPWPARRGEHLFELGRKRVDVVLGEHMVGKPERQAVDQHRPALGHGAQRLREVERRVDRQPAFAAARTVQCDALGHLVVIGLRRSDVGPRRGQRRGELLGMRALAGARTAEKEGQAAPGRSGKALAEIVPAGPRKRWRTSPTMPPSATQKIRLVTVAATMNW